MKTETANLSAAISKAEALAAELRSLDERILARVWVGGAVIRVYVSGVRSYSQRCSGYYQIDPVTCKGTCQAKHPGVLNWANVRARLAPATR